MADLAKLLSDLPPTWKAMTAIAGAVSFGAVMGAMLVGFSAIPTDVTANTRAIRANTAAIVDLARSDTLIVSRLDRLICLQTIPSSTSPLEANRRCP